MRDATKLLAVGGTIAAALSVTALAAPHEQLSGLTQLAGGKWEVRMRDPSLPPEQICVRDGRQLIQLRHRQQECTRFIVSDQPDEVTVQYTCHGRGYGRTHIRRESDRLVQIDSQGIANGLPFNFVGEGRWLSPTCPG